MVPEMPPPAQHARSCAWERPNPGNHTKPSPREPNLVGFGKQMGRPGGKLGGSPVQGGHHYGDGGAGGGAGGGGPPGAERLKAEEDGACSPEASRGDEAALPAGVAIASLAVNACLLVLLLRTWNAKSKTAVPRFSTTHQGPFPGRMPGRSEDPAHVSDAIGGASSIGVVSVGRRILRVSPVDDPLL